MVSNLNMTKACTLLLVFLVLLVEEVYAFVPVQVVCDPGVGRHQTRLSRRTKALSDVVSGSNFVQGTPTLGLQYGRWVKVFSRDSVSTQFVYTYAGGCGRQEVGETSFPDLDPTILAMCLEAAHNFIDRYCYDQTPSGNVIVRVEKHDLEDLQIQACPLSPEKTYCFLGFGETTSFLDDIIFRCRFPGCYMLYPRHESQVFN